MNHGTTQIDRLRIGTLEDHFEKGFRDLLNWVDIVSDEERISYAEKLLMKQDDVISLAKMPKAKVALENLVSHPKKGAENAQLLVTACDGNHVKVFGLSDALDQSDPKAENAKSVDYAIRFMRAAAKRFMN